MANISVTIDKDIPIGQSEHLYVGRLSFDASYPTGGEVIDPSGNTNFHYFHAGSQAGYVFSFDKANQKLLAYRQKDPAAAGGADIPLPQVANTTDLSALVDVPFFAIGS